MKTFLILLCIVAIYLISRPSMFYAIESDDQIQGGEDIKKSGKPMRNTNKIYSPYNRAEIENIPPEIELTNEEEKYLVELFLSLNNIITENSSLEKEERQILGPGKFFWPKNPETPTHLIKTYPSGNFRMTGIALSVERRSRDSRWDTLQLTVFPRNFPYGAYLISFSNDVFKYYEFKRIDYETRVNEQIERPVVYHFASKHMHGVSMKIYSKDKKFFNFPRTFYAIEFKKDGEFN